MDKASKDHPKLTFLLQHVASVKKEKPNDKVDDKLPVAATTFKDTLRRTYTEYLFYNSKMNMLLAFLISYQYLTKPNSDTKYICIFQILIICNKELQTLLEGIRDGLAREKNVNLILLRNISDSFEQLTTT